MAEQEEFVRLRELEDELGSEIVVELVELFLEDAPEYVTTMRQAVAQHEGEKLKRAAHSLKGSSGNLGFERLAFAAARLEQHAAARGCDEARVHVETVAGELDRLHPSLAALRDRLGERRTV